MTGDHDPPRSIKVVSTAPFIVRGPTETVKLGNLTIPKGVHLTLLIGLLHYDPKIWGEDAKEFKPQRFSEGVSNATNIQSSFVPFSSGPRVCIGQNFAMIEAKIALAMILKSFSFELSPSYLHAPFSVVTLTPQFAASITWALKLLNWLWFKPRKLEKFLREQGPNGNPYRPFLGVLEDFVSHENRITTTNQTNSFIWFGPWPRLNVADPELIKEILNKPDVFQKPLPETGKILAGGILFLEGEKWAKHRKIINPAFHLEKLKNMAPAIGVSCSNMVEKLKAMVSSSNEDWCEIDIWPYLEDLTGDVISRTAFGSNHEEGSKIFQLQREKAKLTLQLLQLSFIPDGGQNTINFVNESALFPKSAFIKGFIMILFRRYLPTKTNRKVKATANELHSLLRGIIDKRLKAMERGEAIPADDLLGILLESNSKSNQEHGNKNAGMSIEDVIEECKLFYFAGSETTSSLLVWTMVLLCQHPEWQTQAREEVMRVFGNSEPCFEGLNQLKTVTMILQEVLRLYPPTPLIVRGSTETVKLGNLTIPRGVHLTLLIGLLHNDPEIWGNDAKDFKPQRFSEGVSNATKIQSSFIPFSSGPRICIGQNFAMIEAKIALAMILKSFSFELSPSYLHAPSSMLTLQPQFGAPMILRSLE
ncbi:hypothetical protein DH2020_033670 [Rehmannia glutinosa]|uniref:Uncharacterized protein n=1 Tax=Rehmannia glutinosa TaxID=99300 RepID=A0ABR0VC17_REHGL